jgi:hypothetical protein
MKHKTKHSISGVSWAVLLAVSCHEAERDGSPRTEHGCSKLENPASQTVDKNPTKQEFSRATNNQDFAKYRLTPKENTLDHDSLLEQSRQMLFSVSVGERASIDRKEAWEKLIPQPTGWSTVQYNYICGLLNRHSDSSTVERLVMWRICMTRMAYQAPSNKVIIGLGSIGTARDAAQKKLNDTLFSAIERVPTSFSHDEAVAEANRILDRSASYRR